MAAMIDTTPERLRREVADPPATAHGYAVSAVTRCFGWLFAAVVVFAVGVVAMIVENVVHGPPARVTGPLFLPPLLVCLVTAVLSAGRAGVAWYVSEERWERAGRLLRWVVVPGNRDLVIAVVLVGLGEVVAHT